jgi:hypothetical protein
VLERRLGGEVGHEENGVLAKKSAVRERDDEGTSRGVDCRFGSGVGMSAKGLEKNAAVLDTELADWDDGGLSGDSKGDPKKALVFGEGSERVNDDSEAGEYE